MPIFEYSASLPNKEPNSTVTGRGGSGGVVWTLLKVRNATFMAALDHIEFWECVKKGLPLLNEIERAELIRDLGGIQAEEYQAVLDALADAEAAVESARGDVHVVADRIAERIAEVIDLGTERAKRRPEPVNAA